MDTVPPPPESPPLQPPRVPPTPAPSLFVALRHRNFRLLWAGQLVSFSGTTMQSAAILWHVSLLVPEDRKGLALGMVGLYLIGCKTQVTSATKPESAATDDARQAE